MVPVGELKLYERNPRIIPDEAVEKTANSIREFGFLSPIVADERGTILAGHTRLKAAMLLGMEKVPAVFAAGLSEARKRAYRIADNATSDLTDWDPDVLAGEIADLPDFDFCDFGLDVLAADVPDPDDTEDVPAPDLPETPVSVRGDIYLMGDHRLMCGDACDGLDVAALMDGGLADMVFTDPPWNVDYGNGDYHHPARRKRTILNDSMSTEDFKEFMSAAFGSMRSAIKGGGIAYVVMSAQEWGNLMLELKEHGMHWSSTIIWMKDVPVLSRKDYNTQYEPIWYGWEGSEPRRHPVEDHTQTDIWTIPRPRVSDLHPTMKPIPLVARAVSNSSDPGDTVLDLFGGAGSTLIACEQLHRRCCMMELDPACCDVIVKRWEGFTGKKAVRMRPSSDGGRG